MLYKIRCNSMHPLNDVLPGPYVSVRLHAVPSSYIGILMRRLAAEPRSSAGLSFSSLCPSGTILLTPHSTVWDWRVSRVGPMLFYWHKLLYPTIVFYYFSLSLSVYRLVLSGWGLRTDTVYITFSQRLSLALPTSFNNNNIIIIIIIN